MNKFISLIKDCSEDFVGFLRLSFLSALTGGVAGVVGCLFHYALSLSSSARESYPFFIFLLPIAGLTIAFIYRRQGGGTAGTDLVIMAAKEKAEVPGKMVPMIFAGTTLTQLCGGSAGREGAALQLGGGVGGVIGRLLKVDAPTSSILVMCGMSACFSALFGTPLSAAAFVLELECIGVIRYTAFLPCVFSSVIASATAGLFRIESERFIIPDVRTDIPTLIRVILVAGICSAVSIAFCAAIHSGHRAAERVLKNAYVRIAVGGILVVAIASVFGYENCLGAGMNIVEDSLGDGVPAFTFIVKFILTVITVSVGFRGGEIVPAFAIGSSLGCVLGPILGLDPSISAGVAMISMFCGVTNCPLASIFLAAELFDFASPVLFAVAASVGYALSGRFSLYSTQSILFSKTSPSKDNGISDIYDMSEM